MSDEQSSETDNQQMSSTNISINLNEGNATAIESITERLNEVTNLAEQLDMALRGAQQDCALNTNTPINQQTASTNANCNIVSTPIKKIFDGTAASNSENWYSSSHKPSHTSNRTIHEDNKSDDEFLTASECTVQSRSSSFHTASECGALSPWWELDRTTTSDDLQKEKMVIAVGLPELPNPKTVLKPSPEVPPGKIVHEVTETTHLKVQHCHTLGVASYVLTSETVKDGKNIVIDDSTTVAEERVKYVPEGREEIVPLHLEQSNNNFEKPIVDDPLLKQLKESGDWILLKILEIEPDLTLLGDTLNEAIELQRAHNEVLLQLQNKQSPVEELLRQADQLIATQKPRTEVYHAMAEQLALAWKDVNAHLEKRRQILDFNVLYHTKADECKEHMQLLEQACHSADIPIDIDAVKKFLTKLHDMRRNVLESLMPALQQGNQLLDVLRQLAETGTLDSRPEKIKIPCNQAIAQVERWMEALHDRRRLLELSWEQRKTQLEQCLALAFLAKDIHELEETLLQRRQTLINNDQLGDSSSSAELFLNEHNKLYSEAKELQDKALKITKATEQCVSDGCFAGDQATAKAYFVLEMATQYLNDLENRQDLLNTTIEFFKKAEKVLNKLDQIELDLTNTEIPRTTSQLVQLHAECASQLNDLIDEPILLGNSIINLVGDTLINTDGIKMMIRQLENKKIYLDGLCTAHKEERRRVLEALDCFYKRQRELGSWLTDIAEAFLLGHQDMGSDIVLAKDFLDLHTQLLRDVQEKGTQINTLLLTLPPVLEHLNDTQRQDVDKKVEALHECWVNVKNLIEGRLDLAGLFIQFLGQANNLETAMDSLEDSVRNRSDRMNESAISKMEEQWLSLKPLYNKLKNAGKHFIEEGNKVIDPHLDIQRACLCVESILERLANRQLVVSESWQCWQTELSERREILIQWEKTMTQSSQAIDWVTKLENQLYPIITSPSNKPLVIASDLEEKLDCVLTEIRKALKEIDECIKTTDLLTQKSNEIQSDSVKQKLSDLNTKLTNIIREYEILVQMMIAYFKNMQQLTNKIDALNHQYNDTQLPNTLHDIEQLIQEHEASKQTVIEMFQYAQNECDRLITRINKQEPSDLGAKDIARLLNAITVNRNQWETLWDQQKHILEQHHQFCQFDNDLTQINETLDDLTKQLENVKGQYGESLASAKSTSHAFVYFEKTIELLEDRIQNFINAAEKMLDNQHIQSAHIQRELQKLQPRWRNLRNQVKETRRLIDLSIKYFELVDQADEWFKEGNKVLANIARKSTMVKQPEEVTELLNEIDTFLKPGERKQDARIAEITKIALELFGPDHSTIVSKVLIDNQEMQSSFSSVTEELNILAQNLKTAEEEKKKREQEEIEANLMAAKAEAEAAKAAAQAADEARKAAEAAAKNIADNVSKQTTVVMSTTIQTNTFTEIHNLTPGQQQQKDKITSEKATETVIDQGSQVDQSDKGEQVVHIIHVEKEEQPREVVIEELPQPQAPKFILPLADVIIQEGSKFIFKCQVTGHPLPLINWYKDGISIENNLDYKTTYENGDCTLTIEETFTADSARFSCKAINALGSDETSAYLSVKETEPDEQLVPPSFIKTLSPACAREGDKFQFECTVQGNPLPTVQWFKNEQCIDNSPDYIITYNNGEAILTFEEVFLEDKAKYTCKAENPLGVIESTASLAVEPLEPTESPYFSVPLSNVMARAGQKFKLECEFTGIPQPTITWLHDGHPIKETHDIKLFCDNNKATLIVNEAFPKNTGTYTVKATNLAGEATSICHVTIKGRLPAETSDSEIASDMEPIKPTIQTPLKDQSVFEGNRVRLDCIIVGQPEPEVIWYHDGRPVKESNDFQLLFQGDKCSLIISEAYLEDAGVYKAVAINSAGEATCECKLSVLPLEITEHPTRGQPTRILPTGSPPIFNKLLTDVLVSEGENVILECNITGDPKPEIKWLLNNQEITSDSRLEFQHTDDGIVSLKIPQVTTTDRGVYTVRASNPSGDAKCFAQLIVKTLRPPTESIQRPQFTQNLTDKNVTEKTLVTFECCVIGKPMPKVQWLLNGESIISGNDFIISSEQDKQTLTIPSTSCLKQGKIMCTAENEGGKATSEAKLTVSSIALIPAIKPVSTESLSTYKSVQHQVFVQSSKSSTSFVSTTQAGPKAEAHSYSVQTQESFKSENDKPTEQVQIKKVEEVHQTDKSQPIVQKETTVRIEKSDQKVEKIYPAVRKITAPRFITPIMGRIVDQDMDVVLEGVLDGSPPPEVTWMKNGQPLQPEENRISISFNLNKAHVELKRVSSNDAGKYTCTAINEAGSASSTADVVVKKKTFPPVFGKRLQAQLVKKGERVVMEVEITGLPDPTVTWFKDDTQIKTIPNELILKSHGNCHTLIIEKADLKHGGKYMVKATNSSGEAQSIADFAVYEPTPDTMVEVVKTLVFEDVQKTEKMEFHAPSIVKQYTTETKLICNDRQSNLEPFPFKPDSTPPAKTVKCPPPPSPSKFIKKEFRESDYESDLESRRIQQSVWNQTTEKSYHTVKPSIQTYIPKASEPSPVIPPSQFDVPPKIDRPKFKPIDTPNYKTEEKLQISKHEQQSSHTTVIKPKAISAKPIERIVATSANKSERPDFTYTAKAPNQVQYYRSITSAPYHNAIQTETSNVVQFNESTENSHRVVNIQQTKKIIKFGEKTSKEKQEYSFQPKTHRQATTPPKPKRFTPGDFRESDYESEVESAKIRARWTPYESDTDEPYYRRVKAPMSRFQRSSSVPTHQPERVLTPMEFDTQPPMMPTKIITNISDIKNQKTTNEIKRFSKQTSEQKAIEPYTNNILLKPGSPPEYGYVPANQVASKATKMATRHMDEMTHTFKSKAQQFVHDVMTDVNKKQTHFQEKKPILKTPTSDSDAQVYREESRVAQHGTKHVDPDTGLIYFKYDFGYEFGIVLPGVGKNGEIPQPKKTIIEPPKRYSDIEVPIIHEKSGQNNTYSQSTNNNKRSNYKRQLSATTNGTTTNKWEPTSESEMSECWDPTLSRRKRYHSFSTADNKQAPPPPFITIPNTPSPASLSPSIPSHSPAGYNNLGLNNAETPVSIISSPGNLQNNHIRQSDQATKPPMFITPLRDIAALSGQTAKFECIIQAEPMPNILWTKNGRLIGNSNEYQTYYRNGVCRLTIPKAYPGDAGQYNCTATNSQGTASTTATLQVPGERRSSYI